MSVHAPYDQKGSISIRLPVDPGLFVVFPPKISWKDVSLTKKDEFHVTLLHVQSASMLARKAADEITSFFNSFVANNPIKFTSFLSDFRYVEEGEKRTIVVRCMVSNLDGLFGELNRTFGIDMPIQPAHVTLYTLQRNVGIHILSEAVMEALPQVHVPELEEALKEVHLI